MTRLSAPITVLLLLLATVWAGSPVRAASPENLGAAATQRAVTPKILVRTSATTVPLGERATFRVWVRGSSRNARVDLQRAAGRKWVKVKTATVSPQRSTRFRVVIKKATSSYRFKVRKNKSYRARASKIVTITGSDASGEPDGALSLKEIRQLILDQTNDYRSASDKAPLKLMPELNTVAQNWTSTMADSNTFAHNPHYASQYPAGWALASENIAASVQPEAVVKLWFDSGLHRDNLLGDYTHLGVGFAFNPDSDYDRYYTQNFAKY